MFFRILLMLHRWVGVALCTLFLLGFPSGIGMMYWGMPAIFGLATMTWTFSGSLAFLPFPAPRRDSLTSSRGRMSS